MHTPKPTSPRGELLLHPLRLRIVMALSGGRQLTTRQICDLLPGEARATVYRQVRRLVTADILEVAATRPVRGSVEQLYTLAQGADVVPSADWEALGRHGHQAAIPIFMAEILAIFQRYVDQTPVFVADDVRYIADAVSMSPAEYREFVAARDALLAAVQSRPETPERQRRLIAILTVPILAEKRADA